MTRVLSKGDSKKFPQFQFALPNGNFYAEKRLETQDILLNEITSLSVFSLNYVDIESNCFV